MSGFDGSSATCAHAARRADAGLLNSVASPVQTRDVAAPLWMNDHVAPPSVDL
jgi:hypothetical protein